MSPSSLSCFDGSRCSACTHDHRCIPGNGPVPSSIMAIGERPGKDEEVYGIPFCGKSGEELNYGYLPIAGLSRSDIYTTNVVHCGANGDRKPNKSEFYACSEKFLKYEIEACNPDLIILLGATACSLSPNIKLSVHHGIPQEVEIFGETRWVLPTYHPAAGMRNSSLMIPLLDDFEELGRIIQCGNYSPITDAHPGRVYIELDTVDEIDQTFDTAESLTCDRIPVGLDTEDDSGTLFSAQYSLTPDDGYFIRGHKLELLQHLGARLRPHIAVIQNDLYDLAPLSRVGVNIHRVIDPMKLAYHLGNLPQGLKSLAYRLCGMRMRDYMDVVMPHSRRVMTAWLRQAIEVMRRDSTIEIDLYKKPLKFNPEKHGGGAGASEYSLEVRGGVTYRMGTLRHVEPELTKGLNRVITHTEKPIDDDAKSIYNPWVKLTELAQVDDPAKARVLRDQLDKVISVLGDPPKESIRHVPIKEAITYGCLHYASKVSTPTGYKSIGELVRDEYRGLVYTYDRLTKKITTRKVTGHYKYKHATKVQWLSVETEHSRSGAWGFSATRYTHDHRLLTPRGYRRVDSLKPGDLIYLPVSRLNEIEWQIVYGSILGDGTIPKRNSGGWASLSFCHSHKQFKYLMWKSGLLTNLTSTISKFPEADGIIDGKKMRSSVFHKVLTQVHPELAPIRSDSYLTLGSKNVGDWIMRLGCLGLAIWYQDDGTLVDGKYPRLYTLGFLEEDVKMLQYALCSIFGVDSNIREARRGQWYMSIPVRSCSRFFDLIAEYVHPSMDYKLPSQWKGYFSPVSSQKPTGLVTSEIRSVRDRPIGIGRPDGAQGPYHAYCIDVDQTHNFLTMGEVVHNCDDSNACPRVLVELDRRCHKLGELVPRSDYDV